VVLGLGTGRSLRETPRGGKQVLIFHANVPAPTTFVPHRGDLESSWQIRHLGADPDPDDRR
jgi:hypothetical protein